MKSKECDCVFSLFRSLKIRGNVTNNANNEHLGIISPYHNRAIFILA